MNEVLELLDILQFQPITQTSGYAEVDGCSVKLTILGAEPTSLMFAFFVGTKSIATPLQLELIPSADKRDLTLEDGFVWLSLFNLGETTSTALAESVRSIVSQLKAMGFEFDRNCGLCGARETPIIVQDEQPVRICDDCVAARQRKTEELNRASFRHLLWLPLGALGAAISWAAVWVLIDLFTEWLNFGQPNGGLEINKFTIAILFGFGVLLFLMAGFMGDQIRIGGSSPRFSELLSVILALAAIALGEMFYVTVTLFRTFGVVNFGLAAKVLIPWVLDYPISWLILKGCLALCLIVGGVAGAGKRVTAPWSSVNP